MILMDDIIHHISPNPTPAEFIAVTTLVHQNISRKQPELVQLALWNSNSHDVLEVEVTSLHVRHSEVGDFGERGVLLLLGVFGHSPDNVGNFAESPP